MLPFGITEVKIVILISYFLIGVMVILFSLLYLSRTLRAGREIGLQAPSYIKMLVRISIGIAALTALFIAIFLVTHFY